MQYVLITLVIILLCSALVARLLAGWLQARSGLPVRARVIQTDTGAWKQVDKPLYSDRFMLTGKPDYLVEIGKELIPIEVKPNRLAREPVLGDSMQLAAYCLLVEEAFGRRPRYGLLKYRDAVFQVDFTDLLREELLKLLEEMSGTRDLEDVARNHNEAARCRACGYRAECGQAIREG